MCVCNPNLMRLTAREASKGSCLKCKPKQKVSTNRQLQLCVSFCCWLHVSAFGKDINTQLNIITYKNYSNQFKMYKMKTYLNTTQILHHTQTRTQWLMQSVRFQFSLISFSFSEHICIVHHWFRRLWRETVNVEG